MSRRLCCFWQQLGAGFLLCLQLSVSGLAQQPTSAAPLFVANSQYVQGRTWADYKATPGRGLALDVAAAGTAYCGNPPAPVSYAGGALMMTDATTNYISLDPAAGCIPAKNATGFSAGQVRIATVVTAGGVITSVTDRGAQLVRQPVGTDSAGSAVAKKLNAVRFANAYSGLDAGEQIAACIVDLPATGGTCDMRGLEGAQTISSILTLDKPVKLLLGNATFSVNSGISVQSDNVSVEGVGAASFLDFAGTSGNLITVGGAGSERANITLRGFRLRGNESTKAGRIEGILAYITQDFVTEHLAIDDVQAGITVFGVAGTRTKARIAHNRIDLCDGYGISFGSRVSSSSIEFNDVSRSNQKDLGAGIFMNAAAGSHNKVVGNHVQSSGDNGIRIQANDVIVEANTVWNSSTDGFRYEGNRITSSGNISYANTQHGFKWQATAENPNQTDLTQANDLAYSNGHAGFRYNSDPGQTQHRLTVRGNISLSNRHSGFYLSGNSLRDFTMSGNIAVGNWSRGIQLDASVGNGVLTSNFLRNNTTGQWSVASGASNLKIFGNDDADSSAFVVKNFENAAMLLDLDSGSNAVQSTLFRFLSLGVTKWQIGYHPSDGAFQVRDVQTADSPYRLLLVPNGITEVNSWGTGAVAVNSRANSSTRGLEIWSGGGSPTKQATISTTGGALIQAGVTVADLPASPANGTLIYCSDCQIANPCAAGGTGAFAKRLNNVWICN